MLERVKEKYTGPRPAAKRDGPNRNGNTTMTYGSRRILRKDPEPAAVAVG